ncbi:hypothetical protein PMAC_000604 [Pneumocystis sp. 'macacae']|nr:hypothetical protein PMAC_000604 [Pneumocystis sp. 'macacae']
MVAGQERKQTLLRKVKSTSFFRNRRQEHTFNILLKTIPPLISKENELSENSSEAFQNTSYQNNGILENQASYSKFDIYRDIYELNQKYEIQQIDVKNYTIDIYDNYKIEKILHEFVETEKSYVRGLEELIEIYIKKPSPVILHKESQVVFANVLPVFIFHKQYMLPGIIEAIKSFNPAEVLAEEFLKNKDILKIYSCYVSGFQDKIHIIRQWENSEKGRKYLNSRRTFKSHSQLSLISYLLLPIQRVPRYKLLLSKLLKYKDSSIIRSAFNQICFLAYNMNERRHQEEGSRRLFQLQENLCYSDINIIEPWRRLIKESKMHYLLTTRASFFYDHLPLILDREVSVVLCNDILIIFNYTCTSIIKIINVKELQITHAWERPNIGLRFIFWELEEIWHFDAIKGDADEWVNIINKIHTDS